ncbi:hypothetical protein QBC34DRAFT_443899 [Podospora aff. communis PSN243]|uniref:F-box domain-containing protein n=1 Tax=Podospora aff. communis PSN243 TaxID=3040156 RepID=A0AAV9G0H2_9PEZI|nr:hypothetical protein QBC34DRAFT_443899 [Podospora aff. communis PSN243]
MPLLLDLVVELVECVIYFAADEFDADRDWYRMKFGTLRLNRNSTLATLNRTCKALRELTTRRLYAEPRALGTRAWLLARTLVTCPHLAQLVTSLDLSQFKSGGRIVGAPPELVEYYSQKMEQAKSIENTPHDNCNGAVSPPTTPDPPGRLPYYLLSGLCPNLESLFCENWGCLPGINYFWAPDSMMRLKKFSLDLEVCPGTGRQHWHCLHDAWADSALLRAAPNIEELSFSSCFGRAYKFQFSMPKVKVLHYTKSVFLVEELVATLVSLPNLEELGIDVTEKSIFTNFTLPDATRAILTHGANMKKVSLSMRKWSRARLCANEEQVQLAEAEFASRGIEFSFRTTDW